MSTASAPVQEAPVMIIMEEDMNYLDTIGRIGAVKDLRS